MTKLELVKEIVPATIAQWTIDTPQYKHSGKGEQLFKMYMTYNKTELTNKYEFLTKRGFIK